MENPGNAVNGLIHENSPYLLAHAHQPVHWQPWGDTAFDQARQENKPILLSIGYSSCHWCHVMAKESFEDPGVAEALNRDFISVKVDREERPGVDAVYMQACQAMTGSGGWPLTVFLTPGLNPFFAGTYFPRDSSGSQVGFLDLIRIIARKWRENPQALERDGQTVLKAFEEAASPSSEQMGRDLIRQARIDLEARFDETYGGFGSAPKFPSPHVILFLMRCALLERDGRSLHMAEKTLAGMYRGGVFDPLGGGFSRYATDRKWLIPHFEKMLYDNALLSMAYTEAWQITGKELYGRVAQDTLDYVLREMTGPEGGFFAAQDADSGGVEGAYYTFTPGEIQAALGEAEGRRFCDHYGVTAKGHLHGKSVLNHLEASQEEDEHLKESRKKLYDYRRQNRSLFTDDKVLAEWNGLMIAALCKAAGAFHRPDYLAAARRAMGFAKASLTDGQGGLYSGWRQGSPLGPGGLNDYAALAWAHLMLYETDFDGVHVADAEALCRQMVRRFFDEKRGDFFLSEAAADLIFRPKEHFDGAAPCGNAMAAYVLFRLARLTGEDAWRDYAVRTVQRLAGAGRNQPSGICFGLVAGMWVCYPPVDISCSAQEEKEIAEYAALVGERFLPLYAAAARHLADPEKNVSGVPAEQDAKGHPAAYYVCQNGACQPPVFSLEELAAELSACVHIPDGRMA